MVVGFLSDVPVLSENVYGAYTEMKSCIEELVRDGASEFISKEKSWADTLFALTVKNLKEKYPYLKMTAVSCDGKDVLCRHLYDEIYFDKDIDKYIKNKADVLITYADKSLKKLCRFNSAKFFSFYQDK